jgi:hypothetical protein
MGSRQKTTLAELLSKQPLAQPSTQAATLETPFFDQLAARAGSTALDSFEALLTEVTGAIDPANIPQFPTSHCLSPEDVYNLEKMGFDQQKHLSSCPWCRNMVAAAQPSEEEFRNLLERCHRVMQERRVETDREIATSY